MKGNKKVQKRGMKEGIEDRKGSEKKREQEVRR